VLRNESVFAWRFRSIRCLAGCVIPNINVITSKEKPKPNRIADWQLNVFELSHSNCTAGFHYNLFFKNFKEQLKRTLRQFDILITVHNIETI